MPSLILPQRSRKQAQYAIKLDPASPFFREVTVFPLAAMPASVGKNAGVQTVIAGTTALRTGLPGKTFATTLSGGDYIRLGAIPTMTTISFTAVVVVKLNDLTNNPTIFESGSGLTGTGSSNNSFQFRANANGSLGAVKDNVADLGSSTAGVITAGRFFTAAVSYGAGLMRISVDGRQVYETASSQTFSDGNFSLLAKDGTSNEKSAGEVALFEYWPRLMSAAEMASITANPWQVFAGSPRKLTIDDVAAGSISGTLNAAEGADTLVAAGTVTLATITGTVAVSEGVDTLAASGSTGFATITGTLARSEGIDTLVAAGAIGNAITGSLTASEGIDIGLAAGTVTNAVITASLVASEGSDTLVASGSLVFVPITGSLARSETPDTLMALGGYAAVTGTVYYRYMRQSKTKIVHYEQE